MQIETIVIFGSAAGALMSLSAALWAAFHRARPREGAIVTITVEDAAGRRTTKVARTHKPAGAVLRALELAIREAR